MAYDEKQCGRFFLLIAGAGRVPGDAASSIVDGAKKEGTVVVYGTMTQADMVKLNEAFEKKYPFVKGVKLYPVRPELGKDHAEITKLYYSIVK